VRLCAAIKADPQQWTNPTTQVRVGLLDLEIGARGLRRDFPELFPKPGSDWDLRMAVLYRFSRGGGYARSFLRLYRRQLAAMPESQRWGFLREKTATGSGGATRAFSGEDGEGKEARAAQGGDRGAQGLCGRSRGVPDHGRGASEWAALAGGRCAVDRKHHDQPLRCHRLSHRRGCSEGDSPHGKGVAEAQGRCPGDARGSEIWTSG